MTLAAFFAHLDFAEQLAEELKPRKVIARYDRLFLCEDGPADSVWAQNLWLDPQWIEFTSIGDAARKLRAIQRSWMPFSFAHHRRLALITDELPKVTARRLTFPTAAPTSPMGAFTLVEPNRMLASPHTSSPWPHGIMEFNEDKVNPPSRAYLKLWEAFTRLGLHPTPGQRVLDLGASPGGWTWVVANLGCQVHAIDRSPLAPPLMDDPRVEFAGGNALSARPEDHPDVDWLLSDVICYPEKLHEFLQPWLADPRPRNFICTIKFQGENPYDILARFKEIRGSQVVHLYHNRHEVTWMLVRRAGA